MANQSVQAALYSAPDARRQATTSRARSWPRDFGVVAAPAASSTRGRCLFSIWMVSSDVRHYAPAVRFLGWASVFFGAIITLTDLGTGLPGWLRLIAPLALTVGVAIVFLARLCGRTSPSAEGALRGLDGVSPHRVLVVAWPRWGLSDICREGSPPDGSGKAGHGKRGSGTGRKPGSVPAFRRKDGTPVGRCGIRP